MPGTLNKYLLCYCCFLDLFYYKKYIVDVIHCRDKVDFGIIDICSFLTLKTFHCIYSIYGTMLHNSTFTQVWNVS